MQPLPRLNIDPLNEYVMVKQMMNFNMPEDMDSSIIKVIGVGGGGSNAVNHMFRRGIRGVDFVVCNTDKQALDMSPVPTKIALGQSLTEGRGAGAQAAVGRNAALENLEDIKAFLSDNTKMVFITAGMGGGTGTGAAPVIAQVAKEMGILTVAIVTVPFNFEGKRRRVQADSGLEELRNNVDTMLVICNDKLREVYGNLKLSEAFGQADDILTTAAKGIAEIITVEGYINVDFEDVRTVMTNSGVAIMGSAIASGQDRALNAVRNALASPLLNDNNIFGASNILLYISSGNAEIEMDEVTEITDFIQNEAGQEADIIWGNGYDENLGENIMVTIIATGFNGRKPVVEPVAQQRLVVHDLYGGTKAAEVRTETVAAAPAPAPAPAPVLMHTPEPVAKAEEPVSNLFTPPSWEPKSTPLTTVPEAKDDLRLSDLREEVLNDIAAANEQPTEVELSIDTPEQVEEKVVFSLYEEEVEEEPLVSEEPVAEETTAPVAVAQETILGPVMVRLETIRTDTEVEEQQRMQQERMERLKGMNQRFRNPANLQELESVPAFKRRNVALNDVPHSSESSVSRYSIGEGEDDGSGQKRSEIRGNNSFLHDNVD